MQNHRTRGHALWDQHLLSFRGQLAGIRVSFLYHWRFHCIELEKGVVRRLEVTKIFFGYLQYFTQEFKVQHTTVLQAPQEHCLMTFDL